MPDKDYAVLASRVLSYLKRKLGKGHEPSAEETKAVRTALQLIATAFPAAANDPEKMFDTLRQIARANGVQMSESELNMMKMQIYMQRQSEMYQMLSNVMRMQEDIAKNIAGNIR